MPPLKQTTHNSTANARINELNALIGDFEWSELVPDVTVKICPLASTLPELEKPNAFYHDDIHFNYNLGMPFFKKSTSIFSSANFKWGHIAKIFEANK